MSTLVFVILLGVLGLAVFFDIKERRIPNRLVVAGFLACVGVRLLSGGFGEILDILGATLLGIALFFPFFVPGLVGAGDVKLFGVVGAAVGLDALFPIFLFTLVAGGAMGVLAVVLSRTGERFLANLRLILISLTYRVRGSEIALSDVATQSAVRIPYAVAIAAGVGLWLMFRS